MSLNTERVKTSALSTSFCNSAVTYCTEYRTQSLKLKDNTKLRLELTKVLPHYSYKWHRVAPSTTAILPSANHRHRATNTIAASSCHHLQALCPIPLYSFKQRMRMRARSPFDADSQRNIRQPWGRRRMRTRTPPPPPLRRDLRRRS